MEVSAKRDEEARSGPNAAKVEFRTRIYPQKTRDVLANKGCKDANKRPFLEQQIQAAVCLRGLHVCTAESRPLVCQTKTRQKQKTG